MYLCHSWRSPASNCWHRALAKKYYRHSGHPGGIREYSFAEVSARDPAYPIEKAVRGMLPKSILGRGLLSKLKVYAKGEHPHAAQKPQPLTV